MDSWRTTGWRGSSNLRIGSYDFGDHFLLMDFRTATDTGGTGDTLEEALEIRPVVQSASLTIRRTGGGFGTINPGTTTFRGTTAATHPARRRTSQRGKQLIRCRQQGGRRTAPVR